MAIDTANKRASALIDACGILFPPDGTITESDRGWQLGQYSGIAAAIAMVGPRCHRAHVFLPGAQRVNVYLPGGGQARSN